jgi:hypothetical protein
MTSMETYETRSSGVRVGRATRGAINSMEGWSIVFWAPAQVAPGVRC